MKPRIPYPCGLQMEDLTPTALGFYCNHCEKIIKDFSAERHLDKNIGTYCGLFNHRQVRTGPASKWAALSLSLFSLGLSKAGAAKNNFEYSLSQDTAHYQGFVIGLVNRQPVPGAVIEIYNQGDSIPIGKWVTDANGKYQIRVLLPELTQEVRITITNPEQNYREEDFVNKNMLSYYLNRAVPYNTVSIRNKETCSIQSKSETQRTDEIISVHLKSINKAKKPLMGFFNRLFHRKNRRVPKFWMGCPEF